MKFKYTGKGLNNYYGYYAKNGDVLDIIEPNIIAKVKNHKDFKKVAVKKKAALT